MTWWRWAGITLCLVVLAVMAATHPGGRRAGLRSVISGVARCALAMSVWVAARTAVGEVAGPALTLPMCFAAGWFGRSSLGVFNFLVLQWFGVRLQAEFDREAWLVGPRGRWWADDAPTAGPIAWSLLRWVWPFTGWWSQYRYVHRTP